MSVPPAAPVDGPLGAIALEAAPAADHSGRPVAARPVTGRTVASAAWLIAARLLTKAIDLFLLLVLARALTPADFGIVAIAMTLVQIVEAVLELPLLQVLVRMPTVHPRHYDTAFTLGATRGVALAAILGALAWPFARIYGDARLLPLIVALSLAPATRGLLSPRMADFARDIDYRRDFVIEVGSKLIAFVISTAIALSTHSYWALAIGTITTPVTMMAMSYVLAPHRPRLALFDWREFAGFLGWTTASQFVAALNWQLDRLLLGRFVPKASLGQYSMANDLSYLPEQAIIRPILRPLLSAFALMSDDPARLRDAYIKTAASVLAFGLPVMLGLSVLAGPAVRLALGGKWLPAIPVLELLSLSVIPPLFVAPLGPLAVAVGRTRIFLRGALLELALRVPLMTAGALTAGIWGVVAARLVIATIMTGAALWFAWEIVRISIWRQIVGAARPLAAGGVLTIVLVWLRPLLATRTGLALAIGLALVAAAGCLAYGLALLALWRIGGGGPGFEADLVARAQALLARRRSA